MQEHPLSDNVPKESVSEVSINGEWKIYGLMSKSYNTPYQHGRYLGTSKEIRIDGVLLKPRDVESHFWKKTNP